MDENQAEAEAKSKFFDKIDEHVKQARVNDHVKGFIVVILRDTDAEGNQLPEDILSNQLEHNFSDDLVAGVILQGLAASVIEVNSDVSNDKINYSDVSNDKMN